MARIAGGANKLTGEQKLEMRRCIVQGMGVGQINELFSSRGWEPVSDTAVWRYKQDPDVQADIARVTVLARSHGMANRWRLIESLSYRLCQISHRLNGTTPKPDDIELVDKTKDIVEVDRDTYVMYLREEAKLRKELAELTSDPVQKNVKITKQDAAGVVESTTTVEGDGFDHISEIAQMNDAFKAALDAVEMVAQNPNANVDHNGTTAS